MRDRLKVELCQIFHASKVIDDGAEGANKGGSIVDGILSRSVVARTETNNLTTGAKARSDMPHGYHICNGRADEDRVRIAPMESLQQAINSVESGTVLPLMQRNAAVSSCDNRYQARNKSIDIGSKAEMHERARGEEVDAGDYVFDNLICKQ